MRTIAIVSCAVLLLLAACGARSTGFGPKKGLVPLAHAPVKKWQHFCAGGNFGGVDGLTEFLAVAGDEGWELVAFTGEILCFKRPAPVVAAPTAEEPPLTE